MLPHMPSPTFLYFYHFSQTPHIKALCEQQNKLCLKSSGKENGIDYLYTPLNYT